MTLFWSNSSTFTEAPDHSDTSTSSSYHHHSRSILWLIHPTHQNQGSLKNPTPSTNTHTMVTTKKTLPPLPHRDFHHQNFSPQHPMATTLPPLPPSPSPPHESTLHVSTHSNDSMQRSTTATPDSQDSQLEDSQLLLSQEYPITTEHCWHQLPLLRPIPATPACLLPCHPNNTMHSKPSLPKCTQQPVP